MVRSTSILPRVQWSLSAVLVSVVCAQAALAGPDFDEGPDAGGLPPTSKAVASSSSAPVGRVSGSTSVAALTGDGDRVDMFLVRTGSNTAEFKWTGPNWGARLTLFKKETFQCTQTNTTVTLGRPICTVVKASAANTLPELDGSKPVYFTATGPSQGVLATYLVANSEYYVAVSGATNIPYINRDSCSLFGESLLWANTSGAYGQFLAPAEDRTSSRITRWQDPDSEAAGSYSMVVAGTLTVPASTCRDVVDVVGSPVQKPFDFGYAPAVPAGTPNVLCAPGYTVTRQFFYTWSPQCSGPAVVTTCGLTYADTAIEVFVVDACSGDTCAAAATEPIACNDQCLTSDSSRVTFTATAGATYLVRLTRLGSWGGQTGTIEFTCTPTPASADLNGDGLVNGADLAALLGQWGPVGN